MKIALIQCPSWTTESPPYALALLSSVLKKNGYNPTCFDLNIDLFKFCKENVKEQDCLINNQSWNMDFRGHVWYAKDNVLNFINKYEPYIDKLVESIVNTQIKIIGFSAQSTSKFFSLEIARRIKEKDKDKIIIFGGPLCFRDCYGINTLRENPFLDFVCFAEAEETLPYLLQCIQKNAPVTNFEGFGHRLHNGAITDGGDKPFVKNLDKIPFADYSPFDLGKYTKNLLPISTSRGCINRCSFCSESPHWVRYRRRSAQNIFEEIRYQMKRLPEVDAFWFNDSLINGDIDTLNKLCNLLIKSDIKIKWGGQAMIRKEMTIDLLRKIKLSGCNLISYGIESGSNKVLKLMRKGYPAELAEKVVRDASDAGINVIFNIIVGFPGETENEFKETKDFVSRCKNYATHIETPMFLLLKGSYVYDNLDKFGVSAIHHTDDYQLKWKTKDDLNTYVTRKQRLEELLNLIGSRRGSA